MLTLQILTVSNKEQKDSNKGLLLNALNAGVLNILDEEIVKEMCKNEFKIEPFEKHYAFSYHEDLEIEERCTVESDRICRQYDLYYDY